MGNIMVSLLPFIIGCALAPIAIIITIHLLQSTDNGLLKASAYISGRAALRLLQGLFFGLILTNDKASAADESGKALVVSTLMLVLGILLLISAYKKWRKEDDPDAPPPKWQTKIVNFTPMQTFGMGFTHLFIAAKFWVFTLGAIEVISIAQLGQPNSTVAYLLFVLLAESLLLAPLLIKLILPNRAESLIGSFSIWLTTYNRQIVISVSLIFGLLFFSKGVSGFF